MSFRLVSVIRKMRERMKERERKSGEGEGQLEKTLCQQGVKYFRIFSRFIDFSSLKYTLEYLKH